MFWLIDKDKKTMSLLGDYTKRYLSKDYESDNCVTTKDCNDLLDNEEYELFFNKLLINPLKGYTIKINFKEFSKNVIFENFPYVLFGTVYLKEINGKIKCGNRSSSSSNNIIFLEHLFQLFGYETSCRKIYDGIEEREAERCFFPAFYYGQGTGCCMFVKKPS